MSLLRTDPTMCDVGAVGATDPGCFPLLIHRECGRGIQGWIRTSFSVVCVCGRKGQCQERRHWYWGPVQGAQIDVGTLGLSGKVSCHIRMVPIVREETESPAVLSLSNRTEGRIDTELKLISLFWRGT